MLIVFSRVFTLRRLTSNLFVDLDMDHILIYLRNSTEYFLCELEIYELCEAQCTLQSTNHRIFMPYDKRV